MAKGKNCTTKDCRNHLRRMASSRRCTDDTWQGEQSTVYRSHTAMRGHTQAHVDTCRGDAQRQRILLRGEFLNRIAGDRIGNGMLRAWLWSRSVRERDKWETRGSLGATETEWVDTERGGSWRDKRDALSICSVELRSQARSDRQFDRFCNCVSVQFFLFHSFRILPTLYISVDGCLRQLWSAIFDKPAMQGRRSRSQGGAAQMLD